MIICSGVSTSAMGFGLNSRPESAPVYDLVVQRVKGAIQGLGATSFADPRLSDALPVSTLPIRENPLEGWIRPMESAEQFQEDRA